MIDIEKKYLTEICEIIKKHMPNCKARVFGSRITGKAQKYSDIDIALVCEKKIDWHKIEKLKDEFASSNLPMIVDIVDWNSITPEFRSVIEKKYETLEL